MINKIQLLIFLLIISIGCNRPKLESVFSVNPYSPIVNDRLTTESLFSYSEIIDLETSPNCVIGQISDVAIAEGLIFIYDRMQKSILVFHRNGDFNQRLAENGDIGIEIGEFSDMCLKPDKREIAVLDVQKKQVYIFSVNTLELLHSFHYDGMPRRLLWLKDQIVLFSPSPFNHYNDGYKISIYNESGELLERVHHQKTNRRERKYLNAFNTIFKTKEGYAFWDLSMSGIIEQRKNDVRNLLEFASFPIDFEASEDEVHRRIKNDLLITQVMFNHDQYYLSGFSKRRRISYVFLCEEGALFEPVTPYPKSPYSRGICSSIHFLYPYWPQGVTSNGEFMYQVVDRLDLLQFKERFSVDIDQELINDISRNPLLIIKN